MMLYKTNVKAREKAALPQEFWKPLAKKNIDSAKEEVISKGYNTVLQNESLLMPEPEKVRDMARLTASAPSENQYTGIFPGGNDFGFSWNKVENFALPENEFFNLLMANTMFMDFIKHYGFYYYGEFKGNVQIIAIALPAYFNLDIHPFMPYCKYSIWVKDKNVSSPYGDFGYYILNYDLNNKSFAPVFI